MGFRALFFKGRGLAGSLGFRFVVMVLGSGFFYFVEFRFLAGFVVGSRFVF